MARVHRRLAGKVEVASSAEKAGLGPRTGGQRGIKAGRLKGQLFACGSHVCFRADDRHCDQPR